MNVGEYMVTSKFIVSSLWSLNGDIILGATWMETPGTFILNTKKTFLTFSDKKKNITLQDSKLKSDLVTSEDLINI